MDPSELPAYLTAIQQKVAHAGATPAVIATARAYAKIVRRLLSLTSHAPGTFPTPSAPGSPPSMTTGRLRGTVRTAPGLSGGSVATASVAPHTIYAAAQEWGATMHARNFNYMHWIANGRPWWRKRVELPERPYMRPAVRIGIGDGSLAEAAAKAFEAAVWG